MNETRINGWQDAMKRKLTPQGIWKLEASADRWQRRCDSYTEPPHNLIFGDPRGFVLLLPLFAFSPHTYVYIYRRPHREGFLFSARSGRIAPKSRERALTLHSRAEAIKTIKGRRAYKSAARLEKALFSYRARSESPCAAGAKARIGQSN